MTVRSISPVHFRTSPRTPCETAVGNTGGKGYDGGHPIAGPLKGVGKRINLVPMQHPVDTGIYKEFENGVKKCLKVRARRSPTTLLWRAIPQGRP